MLWRMVTAGVFDCLDNDASVQETPVIKDCCKQKSLNKPCSPVGTSTAITKQSHMLQTH